MVRLEISAKSKLRFEPVPEDIDYLMTFARDVTETHLRFITIRDGILRELDSSRDKLRGPFPHITRTQAQKPTPPIDKL